MEHEAEEPKAYYPRPSSAGPERCIRQMVYAARNEIPKPLSGRAVEVFSDGHIHQMTTEDRLRKSAFEVHSVEMGVDIPGIFHWMPEGLRYCKACDKDVPYRDLHAHLDLLFDDVLGVTRLCDVKGLSTYGYEALCKGEIPLDYLTQQSWYLRALQAYNPDIREAVLLVKNKNTSAYMEYRMVYDPAEDSLTVIDRVIHTGEHESVGLVIENITNASLKKFAEIEKHRAAGTLPERQYEHDHWRCSYCSFGKACWSTWVEEHEKLIDDAVLEGEVVDIVKLERQRALEEANAKNDKDQFRAGIKNILKAAGVRQARVGDYIVSWTVGTRKKLNEELLPPGAYQAALEDKPSERLTINRIKKEDEK